MTAPKGMTRLDGGVENGILWATCEAPLYEAVNGYVLVPEGHPLHGLGYEEVMGRVELFVELTYDNAAGWIGFDRMHLGDWWPGQAKFHPSLYAQPRPGDTVWSPEMVAADARRLARIIGDFGNYALVADAVIDEDEQ